jgi:hypothetical protein
VAPADFALRGLVLAALLLPVQAADASPSSARLVYERGSGASACPTAEEVQSSVAARLGYDPFTSDAERTISARVDRVGAKLSARIELRDRSGQVLGSRSLASTQLDCDELAAALALAITITVDPKYLARTESQPSAPEPAATPPPAKTTPVRPRPPPTKPAPIVAPPQRPAWAVRGTLGVLGAVGTAPAVAVGAIVGAGVRVDRWSLGLEGRLDAPASRDAAPGGRVSSALRSGSFVPCVHFGPALLCGLATAGELLGEGEGVTQPREDASFFAALGGRAALEIPAASPIALRTHADLQATLTEVHLELAGRRVWSTPPVSAALGLGIAGQFP